MSAVKSAFAASVLALTLATPALAKMQHVLLISVDGLHAVDLDRYVAGHPASALAKLSQAGTTFEAAQTPFPSDSFPGLLALITGGQPKSTGVWYDDAWARDLGDPKDCKSGGAQAAFDEAVDLDEKKVDTALDVAKLPLDPAKSCAPVYPHAFLRINTIFDVAKAVGHTTAWADKHPSYDLVQGPSGNGVTDLFAPEIAANGTSASIDKTIAYDATKVAAVLHQISGKDHAGAKSQQVPAIFGMNFQAVSVGQKLAGGGYADAAGTPSPTLAKGLDAVDAQIGAMTAALGKAGLAQETLVIITAKHGQSPIDPKLRRVVDGKAIGKAIEGKAAQVTNDSVSLIWLKNQADTAAAADALRGRAKELEIAKLYAGADLVAAFGDPAKDPRVPDIIIQPNVGVIYTKPSADKMAEHGGGSPDDIHVALLLANPGMKAQRIAAAVTTMQVAPTILAALGLDMAKLDAVRMEHTAVLPGLEAMLKN